MHRFDYYDFELAEVEGDDYPAVMPLVSHINTEAIKVLISRQNQLFKRIKELEKKIENMEVKTNESN